MVQISLHIPDKDLDEIDRLCKEGYFQNRADAIRKGVTNLIGTTRQREKEDNNRDENDEEYFGIE